ncbi:MAG TPA: hypothetical protein VGT44_13360 [Ktedonobacteraceae bacterium]|nr:hypothetical protein [Ktedonobacteraceae bacterium]
MDSSPRDTSIASDAHSLADQGEDELDEEAHPHIHLPNPSYWPLVLGIALGLAFIGILIINSTPAVLIVALVFVLIGILGWALEDPMAPIKDIFVPVRVVVDPWKYKIGQGVVDSQGNWLGKVRARFANYVLVERGGVRLKIFYVPVSAIGDQSKGNVLLLTISEADLVRQGYNIVPDDLYEEMPEVGAPVIRGAPQFASRPLSPAETGHYNYGKHSPGINTDAGHSYLRREINPIPQTYVTEEPIYVTDEPVPARAISPD